jgi:hypothetical protein
MILRIVVNDDSLEGGMTGAHGTPTSMELRNALQKGSDEVKVDENGFDIPPATPLGWIMLCYTCHPKVRPPCLGNPEARRLRKQPRATGGRRSHFG